MPNPYSNDLRKRAIMLIVDKKIPQIKVAKMLLIDKSTIYRWYKRYKEEGNFNFRGYNGNKDKNKINLHHLEKIVNDNPHYTLWEMARKIGNITDVTILNGLKNLGYSFKKTHGYIKKEMKGQEESL